MQPIAFLLQFVSRQCFGRQFLEHVDKFLPRRVIIRFVTMTPFMLQIYLRSCAAALNDRVQTARH